MTVWKRISETQPTSDAEIKLRYLEMEYAFATRGDKLRALHRLRISTAAGQSPLEAWTLAMCRENSLPEHLPSTAIGHAAMECCPKWIWWLA